MTKFENLVKMNLMEESVNSALQNSRRGNQGRHSESFRRQKSGGTGRPVKKFELDMEKLRQASTAKREASIKNAEIHELRRQLDRAYKNAAFLNSKLKEKEEAEFEATILGPSKGKAQTKFNVKEKEEKDDSSGQLIQSNIRVTFDTETNFVLSAMNNYWR